MNKTRRRGSSNDRQLKPEGASDSAYDCAFAIQTNSLICVDV